MDFMTLALFIAGFVLLVGGAEWLVRGASRVAVTSGVTPLVIGLTVVAFGTSAPELAVSVGSALGGQPDIAVGNVVGSNILNILVILGLAALITPLVVSQQLIRLDVPLMIGASLLVYLMALDGRISRLEGAVLFAGIVAYVIFSIISSRRESAAIQAEYAEAVDTTVSPGAGVMVKNLGLIVLGLILLVVGARWLVAGAVDLARFFGISELIIGLTIVSLGTSLPEIAASLMAALRGERDIAVGNAVGSNLFNLLCVLGLTSLVSPEGIAVSPAALHFDLPVMLAVAVACLPIFFTDHRIDRWEGALFLAYYVAYVIYLILNATHHPALEPFNATMLWFALPLTGITLVLLSVRGLRRRG
jgi:cation:H+ antiporter